jgi:hypothetical protein
VHRTFETVDASLGTPFSRQQQHPDEPLLVTGRDRLVGFGGLDEITSCYAANELLLIAPRWADPVQCVRSLITGQQDQCVPSAGSTSPGRATSSGAARQEEPTVRLPAAADSGNAIFVAG